MSLVPEKPRLRLGVMPLADAAPIIIAREYGFFARHGLDVAISVESAWASVRDKVAAGLLDAAQMLAPMPLAAALGIDGVGVPLLTALSLNLNGNAITLSEALVRRMQVQSEDPREIGAALKRVIDADRAAGVPPRVFAHVFPFSPHNYELRYWLAGCGIDPDRDVQLVVIPPPQMVAHLRDGGIDGFCVGAPWGSVAQADGIGRMLVTKHQIWNHSPEKVLGVTQEWAQRHPQTHLALIAALIETARWLDQPEHRIEAAQIMAEGRYLDAPFAAIQASLLRHSAERMHGPGLVFHDGAATFPWVSQALWFLQQMQRWGQASQDIDAMAIATKVYRPDIYRLAAQEVGEPCPAVDHKPEGVHTGNWQLSSGAGELQLGADLFFDGQTLISAPA